MKLKKRTDREESQKFWQAVDRLVSSRDARKNEIQVGEPWTDSRRDLSASLVVDLPEK